VQADAMRYASRKSVRKSIGELDYVSKLSRDSVAVFLSKGPNKKVVFAFRGTDLCDPLRFLNYIPNDYEETLQEIVVENSGFLGLFGSDEFNRRFNEDQKRAFLYQATSRYCQMDALYGLSTEEHNAKYFNVALQGGSLSGGYFYAAPNSDCKADNVIFQASTGVYGENVARDYKHIETSKWAQRVIDAVKVRFNIESIIFTGHSLGGSLALHAYLRCDDERKIFKGFNAASLKNLDGLHRALNPSTAVHYRIYRDTTSYLTGRYVPTIAYVIEDAANEFTTLSNEDFHGLQIFKVPYRRVIETNI
jgi:hypothetical protein